MLFYFYFAMHQNAFGGLAPPGHSGFPDSLAGLGGKVKEGRVQDRRKWKVRKGEGGGGLKPQNPAYTNVAHN